jgi:hypothetical protein
VNRILEFLKKYNIDHSHSTDTQYEECITGRFFMIHLEKGVIYAIAGISGGVDMMTNNIDLILSKLFPIQYREDKIDDLLK